MTSGHSTRSGRTTLTVSAVDDAARAASAVAAAAGAGVERNPNTPAPMLTATANPVIQNQALRDDRFHDRSRRRERRVEVLRRALRRAIAIGLATRAPGDLALDQRNTVVGEAIDRGVQRRIVGEQLRRDLVDRVALHEQHERETADAECEVMQRGVGFVSADRAAEIFDELLVHPQRGVPVVVEHAARVQLFAQQQQPHLLYLFGRDDVRQDVAIERHQHRAHRHVPDRPSRRATGSSCSGMRNTSRYSEALSPK